MNPQPRGRFAVRMAKFRHRNRMWWPFFFGVVVICSIFMVGVAGFMLMEGWGFVDSFYMVVITLSTVGFSEVQPLSPQGRVFTSLLILGGVGAFAYLVGAFTQLVVEGRIQAMLGKHRMQKMIDKLSGHFIVCGFGRIGSIVAGQIQQEGHPVVVVEREGPVLDELEAEGFLYIAGDATSDEVLLSAGLAKASCLISALTHEAANVYVTLTARQLNPDLNIVARADAQSHVPRLMRAGADRVVLPNLIGGLRMAQTVLRPTVTNIQEMATSGKVEILMEEMPVCAGSEIAGKDLMHAGIRPRLNVIIMAIKKADGEMVFNPGPDAVLEPGDTMVAVGSPDHLKGLSEMCGQDTCGR